MPSVRSISFGVWVKNGSRNESKELSGISHFIEHMMFKGTSNRKARDIAEEFDAIGGQINAYTTKEYTCYYTRTLDTHFNTAIDVLADMFFNSIFDDNEIVKERGVINEEIAMYEDTPEDLVHDLLQYNVFGGSALGRPVLGTAETISTFTHQTFSDYIRRHYSPHNTVIAVAGSFNEDELIEVITKYFGGNWYGVSSETDAAQTNGIAGVDGIYTPGVFTKAKDIEQIHLVVGFPGISVGSDLSYDLAVINTVFGGGMSSRLFQRIREENGLAYSIYSYNASYSNTGLYSVYAGCSQSTAQQVVRLIFEEVEKLFSEPISGDLLRKTKEQIKSNHLLGLESSSNRMSSIGRTKLLLDRILTTDELIEKIDAVSEAGIYSLCERIFKTSSPSLCVVGHLGNTNWNALI